MTMTSYHSMMIVRRSRAVNALSIRVDDECLYIIYIPEHRVAIVSA